MEHTLRMSKYYQYTVANIDCILHAISGQKLFYGCLIKFIYFRISISEELVGPYAENSLINNAEHLHLGLLKGPETLVVLNNVLYTGIHGGDVVRIVDTNIQPVTKFGVDCGKQCV